MPDERGSPHEDVVLCQCSDERALKPVETHSIGFPVPTPVPWLPGARSGRRSNNRAQLGVAGKDVVDVGAAVAVMGDSSAAQTALEVGGPQARPLISC